MRTTTLQIRVDADLRKQADDLFANAGLDLSSAVRLFLRQSVIRRRLPFEVIAEDPFFSEANQRVLKESIQSFERGEAKRHELIDA
ncbi:MAG: type II toxin-antitoxin system RelB/DinJ family antitoxin [Kiritimatiellia bacterium]